MIREVSGVSIRNMQRVQDPKKVDNHCLGGRQVGGGGRKRKQGDKLLV